MNTTLSFSNTARKRQFISSMIAFINGAILLTFQSNLSRKIACAFVKWSIGDAACLLRCIVRLSPLRLSSRRRLQDAVSPKVALCDDCLWGTKRTFKVLRRRSDVEGRADMAPTLPEGDPRYATDFLPRMDGAGCSPGGGSASGSWWPWPRVCQEPRTQELAEVLWPTWRRFDPSSSPSANDTPPPAFLRQ